jgi:hypothetical protein
MTLLGRILLKEGNLEAAETAFKTAVDRFDDPHAWLVLEELQTGVHDEQQETRGLTQDRRERLTRIAILGSPKACEKLAKVENQLAVDALEQNDEKEFEEKQLMSAEWSKLARASRD